MKILVVEDESICINRIVEELENHGILTDVIRTIEVVENIDFKIYDIIILDASLHLELDALHLLEKIIQSGYNKPIIASSGTSSHNDKLMENGATYRINGEDKKEAAEIAVNILKL